MKLHSPQFESGLKHLIKATIKSSPELKREFKRVKRYRKNLNLIWLWRLAVSVMLGFAAWNIQEETGHLATALAGVSVYLLAALCFRIQSLWSKLNQSPDTPALMLLPVTSETIFRWLFQKFLRESAYLLVDLLIIFGALAYANEFPAWKWISVPIFSAVAWLNVMLLAVYGALRLPRWIFQTISIGFILIVIALFFGRNVIGPSAIRLLDEWGLGASLVLPVGWAVAPFELLGNSSRWWLLGLWLPVIFTLPSLKGWLAALREGISYKEFVLPQAVDQIPGRELNAKSVPEHGRQLGPTAVEEIVVEAKYLTQPGFTLRHFPERTLWGWLNSRERALAEFIHPNGMAIWVAWRKLYTILLGTMFLVFAGSVINYATQLAMLGVGAFIIFCMGLANLVNHGRAFAPMWFGGVNVPMYAGYGIGFKELGGLFFKYAVVQVPFLVVAFVGLGSFSAWCLRMPVELGMIFGFKVAGLLLGLRLIILVFAFSGGTNDTSGFRFSAIFLVLFMVMLGLLFVGLGAAGLLVPDIFKSFLFWGGAFLDAWVFLWVYGLFYRFSRFDLMAIPRQ